MLAKLYDKVKKIVKYKIRQMFVLGWIRTPPKLLQTFPSNRVAEIQRLEAYSQQI